MRIYGQFILYFTRGIFYSNLKIFFYTTLVYKWPHWDRTVPYQVPPSYHNNVPCSGNSGNKGPTHSEIFFFQTSKHCQSFTDTLYIFGGVG